MGSATVQKKWPPTSLATGPGEPVSAATVIIPRSFSRSAVGDLRSSTYVGVQVGRCTLRRRQCIGRAKPVQHPAPFSVQRGAVMPLRMDSEKGAPHTLVKRVRLEYAPIEIDGSLAVRTKSAGCMKVGERAADVQKRTMVMLAE